MTSEAQPNKGGSTQIRMIDAEDHRIDDPSEATPLVGAGAGRDDGSGRDSNDGQRGDHSRELDDFEHITWWRRPSVYWLIAPYLFFTLAFGGVIVPKLDLIVDLVCRRYFAEQQSLDPNFVFTPVILGGDNPQCDSAPVQKEVSIFMMIMSVLTGGLSAVVAPKLGSFSDRYGRTRLMVIASCGGVVNEAITILAAKYPETVDYRWLVLGAFFDGITGSFTAGSILTNAYTSDCAPPSKRGVYIGYLHACLFSGLAFGPLLAGYFVKWTGSLLSIFYVVLGCHIFVILFFWFVLPESLSKKRQMIAREKHQAEKEALRAALSSRTGEARVASWLPEFATGTILSWIPIILSANPLAPLKILVPTGRQNRALRRNLLLFAFIDTIIMSSAMGAGAVTILYSKFMFHWGTLEASRFVSIVSMFRVAILLLFFPVVNYFFRVRPLRRRQQNNEDTHIVETNVGADGLDVWILRLALLSDAAGMLGYVFVRTEELFLLSGIITAFGGLAGATIQSSVTKHVPAERVGALLGANGLLHALGRVFAPMLFNGIYAATIETFPQTFFVVLASLLGLAMLGAFFIRPHVYMKEDGYVAVPVREPGSATDLEVLADEEIPSETLPRI
ncbi:MFS general substrate transporter [Xylariaceae sp. FL0016]|nr:MFS general substrate transporter [Xylariaceae sp. FL0016]